MANFLVFSDTIDGKKIVELLLQNSAQVCVSTNSDCISLFPIGTPILNEPKEAEELATLLQSLQFDCVIDASYADMPKQCEQRKAVCAFSDIRYLRLSQSPCTGEECVYVDSPEKAAGVLAATTGKALLTLGIQNLEYFLGVPDFQSRLCLLIKPSPAIIEQCLSMGYRQENMIAMEATFSREMNCAIMRQIGAELLVTRTNENGIVDKLMAVRDVGATAIVIGRIREKGFSFSELLEILEHDYAIHPFIQKHFASYFPLLIDMCDKKLVVFGGGITAAKRVEILLKFGQHLSVITPRFDSVFDNLDVVRIERSYMRGDCKRYDYIFAITDNSEVNHTICVEAHLEGIPVYVENAPEESDFMFPEITHKDTVVITT